MRKLLLSGLMLGLLALPIAAFAQAETTPEPAASQSSADEPTPIEFGQTLNGELTEDQPNAFYTFDGTASQSVSITLESDEFDSYLVLLNADGDVLATNDDGAGNLNSLITFTLPDDGSYIIQVDTYGHYNGGTPNAGAYTLTLTTIEQDVIEYGETIDGELTTGALENYYVFRGNEGDSVSITQISSDFDSYLSLHDPSGYELATNDDGAGNLNSRIGPIVLPADGDYQIIATSLSRSSTGSYTLSLQRVELTPVAFGDTATGELGNGVGQVYYSFDAEAGDSVSISVDSDVDTNLTLSDPYNYQLISDEDSGSGKNPEITDFVLSSAGTYTLVVGAPFGGDGSFELTLERAVRPTLDDGPVTLNFTSSATVRSVTYTGQADEVVTLTVTSDDTVSPSIDVQQDGSSVSYASSSYVSALTMTFTIPNTGEVIINVSEYSYSNASLEVSIASAE